MKYRIEMNSSCDETLRMHPNRWYSLSSFSCSCSCHPNKHSLTFFDEKNAFGSQTDEKETKETKLSSFFKSFPIVKCIWPLIDKIIGNGWDATRQLKIVQTFDCTKKRGKSG